MINRLTEFLAQTRGISTNRLVYFDGGYSYTYDSEQLVQARTNFKDDKKGGEYFKDKTFKIQVDEINEFVKEYKKSIIGIDFSDDKTVTIKTSIPNVKLEFTWDKTDDVKLDKIKNFFKDLDTNSIDDKKKVFDYNFTKDDISTFTNEKPSRMFADLANNKFSFKEDTLDNSLMISIFPKYLGKILSSTKELNLKIYDTDKDYTYLVHYTVRNMNIVSEYFGLCIDLIPIEEGGLD